MNIFKFRFQIFMIIWYIIWYTRETDNVSMDRKSFQ